MSNAVSYSDFKNQWLEDVKRDEPHSVEIGRRFGLKLTAAWRDVDLDTDEIIYSDGPGDGGIDLAILSRADHTDIENSEGDIWYLIQSKYNKALQGPETVINEGRKIIDTLKGQIRLSSASQALVDRINTFLEQASELDKLIFVFATVDPLKEEEMRALEDVKTLASKQFDISIDVINISIGTIHNRQDISENEKKQRISLEGELVQSGEDLLVGSVKLDHLYDFLKRYRNSTGDLDLIYEKNVRKYLGSGRRVNKGIAETLEKSPERFGLYNNGITLVVEDFNNKTNSCDLTEPFIVNGCQTTRTIWNTLQKRLDAGGTGSSTRLDEWRDRLSKGIVVVKIVKVGSQGDELLIETTKYTNSQNAVSQKDFIALSKGFRGWASEMATRYGIFLEIQRGGWISQQTFQNTNINTKRFTKHANAFDLLKNYGAAWMSEPGTAFGKNPPFAPGGTIFKRIVEDSPLFGAKDLYASYLLSELTKKVGFGYQAEKESRGQTRFLFYYVLAELVKDCIAHLGIEYSHQALTNSIIAIYEDLESDAAMELTEASLAVIDDYLNPEHEDSAFKEPKYRNDINSWLKNERLDKTEIAPKLQSLIAFSKRDLRRPRRGGESAREIICEAIAMQLQELEQE